MRVFNQFNLKRYRHFFTSRRDLVFSKVINKNNNKTPLINVSGSEIIYSSLKRNNVEHAFIYSGGSIMPVIDKLYKSSIKYTINSHEQNCGHAATGFTKTSNKKCVVLVTSGPGFTNTITPLLDANNDSTPLVIISGQVSKNAIGTNAFQEAPSVQLSKNVTKWSYMVENINELSSVIDKAYKIAYDKKKGAVHIDIPKCVASGSMKMTENEYSELIYGNKYSDIEEIDIYDNVNNNKFNYVIDLINRSKKPIIYLGQGCKDSYKLLREFAIKSNIPVTSTIHGCGIFDESHSLSLQWCGMHGNPASNFALQEADTIIALGSRFDDRTTGNIEKYAPKAFEAYEKDEGGLIHVNIEKSEINKVVISHYNFNENCKTFLEKAVNSCKYNEREEWINRINYIKKKI